MGNDPGGVTEDAQWPGGGGFRVVEVAPSMFTSEGSHVFLSEWATNGQLAEATAAQLHHDSCTTPLAEMLLGDVANLPGPQPEPVRIDRLVEDGELTAGGGQIVAIPGHTRGSIAVLLPERGVLFTGDWIASTDSAPILSPFNLNTADAVAAVRKQAQLDFEIACVGHGRPIVGNASRKVLSLIRSF